MIKRKKYRGQKDRAIFALCVEYRNYHIYRVIPLRTRFFHHDVLFLCATRVFSTGKANIPKMRIYVYACRWLYVCRFENRINHAIISNHLLNEFIPTPTVTWATHNVWLLCRLFNFSMSHSRALLIIPKIDGDKAITKKCVGYRATKRFYATRRFYTGTVVCYILLRVYFKTAIYWTNYIATWWGGKRYKKRFQRAYLCSL